MFTNKGEQIHGGAFSCDNVKGWPAGAALENLNKSVLTEHTKYNITQELQ